MLNGVIKILVIIILMMFISMPFLAGLLGYMSVKEHQRQLLQQQPVHRGR